MHAQLTSFLVIGLSVGVAIPSFAAQWPGWRGPDGNGVSSDKNLPMRWTDKENVRWRVELPGPGNGSPIVWGDRVFVSQFVKADNRRTLMCMDRKSGKSLWQSGVTYTDNEPTQENNPYCAGTPSTDGENVYVSFGSAGVFAYDFSGKEVWHRELGKLNHMFGNSVSTVIHGDLCVVYNGPDEKSRLVALRKKTGEIAWEVEPPKVDPSEMQTFGGGPGGPGGGRGGFGPGMILGQQMMSQADKNSDQKLSKEEMSALAEAWFDKLDRDKSGKVTQEQFTTRMSDVLPPPPGAGGPPGEGPGGGPGGGGRGFNPGRMAGGLFTAADVNKDGSLARSEWKDTFAKWFTEWDSDKSGLLDENKLREGLNAALPRPNFGGPGGPGGGRGRGGPGGSWSTPLFIKAGNREELIVNFPARVVGLDPATGKQLWISKGLGGTIYSTPVMADGTLIAMSSGMGNGNAIALKPGGSGDVSESQRLWRLERVKSGMGSGVIHDGYFFTVSSDGIAVCLDLKTGATKWEERLKGSGTRSSSWSSMLLADGKIYLPNQAGDTFVIRASPTFEVLATNSVGEPTNASLAASDGEIFMRTGKALWCLSQAK